MAIKIRAAGNKPAAKPKPAAKRRPTASGQRKAQTTAKSKQRPNARAQQKAQTAKRGPGRPRQTEADAPTRNKTGLAKTDPKLEAKLLKAVTAAGDRRREAKIEHEESVNALYEVAKEALEAGVSMAKVSDASDISRQWLYKMGEFAGRENGGNGGGKSIAPKKTTRAAKATPAKRTSTRKGSATTAKRGTTAKKTTAAKPRTRTRIRTAA